MVFTEAEAQDIYEIFKGGELNPQFKNFCLHISLLCQDPFIAYGISASELLTVNSANQAFLNNFPAGTSLRILQHYLQLYTRNNGLYMYDYGVTGNFAIYGDAEAPSYDLNDILNFQRIAILIGDQDKEAPEQQVMQIEDAM